MKNTVIFFISIFIVNSFTGQTKIANELYDNYEFRNAITYYENDQPLKGENLRRLADCYYYTYNYPKVVETYRQIFENEKIDDQDYLKFGDALKCSKNYDEALEKLAVYKEKYPNDPMVNELIKETNFLARKKENKPKYEVSNFEELNSPIANFFTKQVDDKIFYISESKQEQAGAQLKFDSTNDLSILDYGTSVRPLAQLHSYDLENGIKTVVSCKEKFHMNGFDLDVENKKIYFTKIDITKKWKKGTQIPRIYVADIDFNTPEIFNIKELKIPGFTKNDAIGHPALSYDKKHIYFSADLEQGMGGFDIYVSSFKEGEWTEPKNLGSNVNSVGDEYFPNIIDGKFLYFSSNGRVGYGNQDIFKNRLINATNPTESQILQEPINSFADDFGFIYNSETFSGYVTSNRFGGKGDDDIYKVSLKKLIVSGVVKDVNGKPVKGAIVKIYDKDGNLIAETTTDENGNYSFEVNPGEYEVTTETEDGYFSKTAIAVTESWNNEKPIDLNLKNTIVIIQGTVYDPPNKTSANTLVKLIQSPSKELKQVYTDEKGRYKFYADPNKTYEVVALKKGLVGAKKLTISSAWDNEQQVDLNLKSSTTVQGFVYNEDGSASPLTDVSLYDGEGVLIQQSTADAEGRYSFSVDRNKNYQIKAKKKGFEGLENIYTGDNWKSNVDFNFYMFPVTTTGFGYIKDENSRKAIAGAKLVLTDNKTERKFVTVANDKGYFEFQLSKNRDYTLKISKDKYYPKTLQLAGEPIWGEKVDLSSTLNLNLEYAGYTVSNIYFELGSYKIRGDSEDQLNKIVEALEAKPKLNIYIRSYADCRGSSSLNKRLTEKRSKAVREYLTDNGISKKRITTESMGKTNLVNNCVRPKDCTEAEHALNRRSEFEFK